MTELRWWRNRERGTLRSSEVYDVHNDLDRHDYEISQLRQIAEHTDTKQDQMLARMNYILISVVMLLLAVIGNIVVIVAVSS